MTPARKKWGVMKSKRSKACDITPKVRQEVHKRDGGCIFCQINKFMPPEDEFVTSLGTPQIMHFVPRSQGGLGIPENLAEGCVWHHTLLDNGKDTREEMLKIFESYLKLNYPHWNKEKLVFNKWGFLKGE